MDALVAKIGALDVKKQEENDQIGKNNVQESGKVNSIQEKENHGHSKEKFYITTAINYTNGAAHLGHAYEGITSDMIARYHRVYGRDVFFLTGTDEHGQKIAQTAESMNLKPIELCDKYAQLFQNMTKDLNMSNDFFIRTTSEKHYKFAKYIFQRAFDNGDIYLGEYQGWYNVREETFITDSEAKLSDYKDPASGTPLKQMTEQSYFFRMSKYQERLLQHFHDNPGFLQPEARRNEILLRLQEPLLDLSVSRTGFTHGIPLPNDPHHVMYVWFDALSNYMSAIDCPSGENSRFWPADVHIIGKDIQWFHTVIWPCMLMSANFELPKMVFAHGFVNAADGKKMSKSLGNVVDPYDILSRYPLDTFRYFLARGGIYGADMSFSEADLINIHNSDLADVLGNLVHRTVNICARYSNGVVPECLAERIIDLEVLKVDTEKAFATFALQDAVVLGINTVKEINKYLTEKAPWHSSDPVAQNIVVRSVLEAVYVAAHFLMPFIPTSIAAIFSKFNTKPTTILQLSPLFDNLTPGTKIDIGEILFQKLLSEEEKKKQQEALLQKTKPKVEKEKKEVCVFSSMDIRVGVIRKVWEHPESEKLYCEEIDVGGEELVPIASGLRANYTLEQMEGRKCIVILNLKPVKLGGFKSHGMVLCASNEDFSKSEFVEPPENAVVGERVFIDSESGEPLSAAQMKKQKVWEKAVGDLKTNGDKIAHYKNFPWKTTSGLCTVATLIDSQIS